MDSLVEMLLLLEFLLGQYLDDLPRLLNLSAQKTAEFEEQFAVPRSDRSLLTWSLRLTILVNKRAMH